MEYVMTIFDDKVELTIIEGARTNSTGLNAVLKRMTHMNQNHRREFMHTLINNGVASYLCETTDELRYNISAMKI